MFISGITDRGAVPGLVATLAYTQACHKVIAENVANWQNPDYQAKRLDPRVFQRDLARAFEQRGGDVNQPFALPATEQFHLDRRGSLRVTPIDRPTENVLFHDGTNMSIERQMSDLAENAMTHEMDTQLLKERYDGLRKAIRGRL